MPLTVKRHLGLDDDSSWIVAAEGNEFLWPGYDLRKLPHNDRYDYGFLPPRFFNQVLEAFVTCHHAGKRRVASRESCGGGSRGHSGSRRCPSSGPPPVPRRSAQHSTLP